MHFSFMPYGKRELVERLLRDMEAQKHILPMTKGKKKQGIWIDAQIRVMPFGVYEYVFPKEDLNKVLATFYSGVWSGDYAVSKTKLAIMRKVLKLKPIPKFKKDQKYLWRKHYVSVIPIGIREDVEIVGDGEIDKGWTHEAL